MKKLHPKSKWIFFFRFIGYEILYGIVFFPLFLFCVALIADIIRFHKGGIIVISQPSLEFFLELLIGIVVGIIFLDYIWAYLTYYFWRYEVDPKVLKIESGVIWKKFVSIPYERIQNVEIRRGPIARILGLSELQVQTAGYSGEGFVEGRIPGILKEEAEKLKEELIERVKKAKEEAAAGL